MADDEILIVGAGLTGCTMAERLAAAGRHVWLIDQRAHLGGTAFKHLTGQIHPQTTLAYEFPSTDGHPTHPVPVDANHALYRRYVARARATVPQVTFAGRLGTYKYLDMDQCVAQALKLASTLVEGVTA